MRVHTRTESTKERILTFRPDTAVEGRPDAHSNIQIQIIMALESRFRKCYRRKTCLFELTEPQLARSRFQKLSTIGHTTPEPEAKQNGAALL